MRPNNLSQKRTNTSETRYFNLLYHKKIILSIFEETHKFSLTMASPQAEAIDNPNLFFITKIFT
jgi:hypothetical protein